MLPLLSSTSYILICSLSGVYARAVHTTITSIPTAEISSSILAGSVNETAPSQRCGDIDNCRTLNGIVQSCLVTILTCVWFAVHRNIPAPKREPSYHSNFFIKSAQWAWSVILGQRQAAMVFGVALLAPEWILAWALRQAIIAWRLAKKLEAARLEAKDTQMERFSGSSDFEKHAGDIAASATGHSSMDGSVAAHTDFETNLLMKRRSNPSTMYSICDKCEGRGCACDLFASAKRVAKGEERWAMSHAFFVAMGGFCFYNEDGPLYPLSPADVIELVKRGHLVPPTADEISNQGNGDALSKGVAIAQTLWFVIQFTTRYAENLPVTNLEVMTLAYAVMTFAMYATWWAKPLNVSCAIRVPEEEIEGREAHKYASIWERISVYVVGDQDEFVDLRLCKRVPTFWAGKADDNDAMIAGGIALLVAMVFGAVHCISWYSEFQSPLESRLWRLSAITIIAVPAILAVVLFVVVTIAICMHREEDATIRSLVGALYAPIAIIYIVARLILIFLSFASLRGLPFSAYQTVQWTTFIPHI